METRSIAKKTKKDNKHTPIEAAQVTILGHVGMNPT